MWPGKADLEGEGALAMVVSWGHGTQSRTGFHGRMGRMGEESGGGGAWEEEGVGMAASWVTLVWGRWRLAGVGGEPDRWAPVPPISEKAWRYAN
ncbi:hypothetical protein E2562_027186 [Oryza meyeriana var. granulata]|uniref:Uncharacterized protein n=1 Tax=Oryza meyeriana var. granulata TaxID=110450 RepID=A0A6G1EZF9_9ORYZ|nr:hypothetical protein E2562_027186 [Oryza meyeriana var. granulata]